MTDTGPLGTLGVRLRGYLVHAAVVTVRTVVFLVVVAMLAAILASTFGYEGTISAGLWALFDVAGSLVGL